MRVSVLVLACWLLSVFNVEAATYYVRTDGANGPTCNGTVNAAAAAAPDCAWLTGNYAVDNVTAGDTVRFQAGTYAETLTPSDSGTLESPITYVADGAVTFCGISQSDTDYLRWIGFTFDGNAGACAVTSLVLVSGTTTGWEFWHCVFRDGTVAGVRTNGLTDRANNWILIGNEITEIFPTSSDTVAISLRGDDQVFAYTRISSVDPDTFYNYANGSYWLNNYVTTYITGVRHGDIFQNNSSALGTSFNLAEANFFIGASESTDEHGVLLQDQNANGSAQCSSTTCAPQTENMFRRNVWHDFNGPVGGGGDTSASSGIQNTRLVHETMVENVRNTSGNPGYGVLVRNGTGSPQGLNNSFFFNNLNYSNWAPATETNLSVFFVQNAPDAEWTAADYNLAYKPSVTLTFAANWTNQGNEQSNVDPDLADVANDDFTLGASSGAIGTAGPLAVTSGSGTGATFSVSTGRGGFFRGPNTDIDQYGGNLTEGDPILVGSDCLTVSSVSGDDITVTSSFTWGDAENVFYGCDSTPDIGAYPYKAGGYTLTAKYLTGGTYTIVPNDASLVRWVVCYDAGVPYAVDNTSPYTCAAPTGAFTARAFPRYASTTLWADATELTGGARLRVVP